MVTKEQKNAKAVAWLIKNVKEAPEAIVRNLDKLTLVNNEGMALVSKIKELKNQTDLADAEIGEKVGAAKVLFELIAEDLTEEQIEEFSAKFKPEAKNEKS